MKRRPGRPPGPFARGTAAYRERERLRKLHQYRLLHGIPLDAPTKRVGRHCSWREPEWQCLRCRAARAPGHELCAEHLALRRDRWTGPESLQP